MWIRDRADGEYYGGSRPPLGSDKGLRLLQARRADDQVMQIYRIDDAARRTTLVSKGNSDFDARTRPWFKASAVSYTHLDVYKRQPPSTTRRLGNSRKFQTLSEVR